MVREGKCYGWFRASGTTQGPVEVTLSQLGDPRALAMAVHMEGCSLEPNSIALWKGRMQAGAHLGVGGSASWTVFLGTDPLSALTPACPGGSDWKSFWRPSIPIST